MHYDLVKQYAMKCRLYPTKAQAQAIVDALRGVQVFHNCLVYDMWHNHVNVTEKPKKNPDGSFSTDLVHFPNLTAALQANYKRQLIADHPIIAKCPQAALTTNVGLKADLKKEFGKNPIELQDPTYYNDLHPRRSYTYQETLSKIQVGENPNVFRMNLMIIGSVKVRGWNQKLRFGNESTDFLEWSSANPKTNITITISKDTVGDYFIVFKIKECLKPFPKRTESEVGVDVGIKDIAIRSDGVKYTNHKYKKQEKRHQKLLNRKLSRRWGPSNEVFRKARKSNRLERKAFDEHPIDGQKPPKPIAPSRRYQKAREQHARLNRKIARKRDLWNHIISKQIVADNSVIAVETLNISGMEKNKRLSFALNDAAFGTLLTTIQYKSAWHGRTVIAIGKWSPSSKRCSCCGYIYSSHDQYHMKPWSLSIRQWECPVCKTKHDRDINAAKNILYFAKEENHSHL